MGWLIPVLRSELPRYNAFVEESLVLRRFVLKKRFFDLVGILYPGHRAYPRDPHSLLRAGSASKV